MKVRLKICGLTNYPDAEMAVRLGADLLGFNFYPKSPRYIPPELAGEIIRRLPPLSVPVGVLVEPRLDDCLEILKTTGAAALQIQQPQSIRDYSVIPAPVIAGYRLRATDMAVPAGRGESMILLDSFVPGIFGGTGKRLDWSRIPAEIPREKLMLAGGIHPGNVREALKKVSPAVIDVASGSESSPGKKDPEKIRALVEQVQKFNAEQAMNRADGE